MPFFRKPRTVTSRRPFRRTAARLFAVPAVALAALAASQATASASGPAGPTSTVTQTTAAGYCEAGISFYYDSYLVADGWLRNTSQYSCTAWMETSYDGGATFSQSSPTFTLSAYSGTAWHGFFAVYDQGSLLSRTCFKFPWAGAAHHCTGAG